MTPIGILFEITWNFVINGEKLYSTEFFIHKYDK